MAFTVSNLAKSVFGDMRVVSLRVTADATTGNVETGLKNIVGCSSCPQSLSTAIAFSAAINEGAEATGIAGTIGVTGVTSGDEILFVVFGN